MTFALSAIAAYLILAYWTYCRKASLAYQTKAVDLMEEYFAREDVSEKEVNTLYWAYKFSRYWVFLPLMVVITPVVLLVLIGRNGGVMNVGEPRSSEHDEIMENIMFMYAAKHPIVSFLCFTAIHISLFIMVPFGLIFRRLTRMPKFFSIMEIVAAGAVRRESHVTAR